MVLKRPILMFASCLCICVASFQSLFGYSYEYQGEDQSIQHPTIQTCVEGMDSHQKQWYNFQQYTANLDVPGYVEYGGYNYSKGGKITIKNFWRWRYISPPEETGRDLDVAVDYLNRAFFCVRLPNGMSGYTRDGRLKLIYPARNLVTLAGELPILNESDQPISLPQGNDIAFSKSGVIYVDNNPIDKLKIAVFKSEKTMTNCLDSINGVVFYERYGTPDFDDEAVYAVRQGYIERPSVIKGLIGDGTFAKYGSEASAKLGRTSIKTMTSVIQMANP